MTIKFEQKEEQEHKLQHIRMKEAEENAQKRAKDLGVPYVNLAFKPIQRSALELVPELEAKKAGLAVISQKGDTLTVVAENPNNPLVKRIVEDLQNRFHFVSIFTVSRYGLNKAWNSYIQKTKKSISGAIDISQETFEHFRQVVTTIKKLQEGVEEISIQQDVSIILELLLASAMTLRASDIHIEPEQNNIVLRIRIDGIMHNISRFDNHMFRLLISRVKLLSGMKLNVHNAAQDGRFSVAFKDTEIQIRTSVLPGEFGENIVMRLLDPKSLLSVEELGLNPDLLNIVNKELTRPNGMILVTGPTGSGKTTTLYAFLKRLITPKVEIITIEDPIEYRMEGIAQTQVSPEKGYTFANGLRSILRQDPDIILVGEIRDLETVDIALQASLTGHLVFSTLHTNDAAGTIPRMMDLGASLVTIGQALNMAIAQRLMRRVCKECGTSRKVKPEELSTLKEELRMPEEAFENLEYFKTITKRLTPELKISEVKGCELCHNSGYKGRIGVYEIILVEEKLEKFIAEGSSSSIEIKEFAKNQGMTTLKQDAFSKIVEGISTFEEVDRVIE